MRWVESITGKERRRRRSDDERRHLVSEAFAPGVIRHGVAEADLATEPVDCPLCSLAQVRGASAVLGLLVHDYTFNSTALWSHSEINA